MVHYLVVAGASASETGVVPTLAMVAMVVVAACATEFKTSYSACDALVATLAPEIVGTTQPVSAFASCTSGRTTARYTRTADLADDTYRAGFARTDFGSDLHARRLRTPLAGTVAPMAGSGVLLLGAKNPGPVALVAGVLVRLNQHFDTRH